MTCTHGVKSCWAIKKMNMTAGMARQKEEEEEEEEEKEEEDDEDDEDDEEGDTEHCRSLFAGKRAGNPGHSSSSPSPPSSA